MNHYSTCAAVVTVAASYYETSVIFFSTPFPPFFSECFESTKNALNGDKEYDELEAELSRFQSLPDSTSLPANITRDELRASLQGLTLLVISLFDEPDVVYYMLRQSAPKQIGETKRARPSGLTWRSRCDGPSCASETANFSRGQ